MFLVMKVFKINKQFRNMTQVLPEYGHRWYGMWENNGRYLHKYSLPMVWNFTYEKLQDSNEVVECLKEKCCGYSKEAQLTALRWALPSIYQMLLDIVLHPQGGERENKPTGTAATPIPPTGTAAEQENLPVQASVAPIQKKKYTKKTVQLVRDNHEPEPSQEQEGEAEPEVATQSLSVSEMQDMWKDLCHHPGTHIVTWLLQHWDNGDSNLELEGREAKELGSLSRQEGTGEVIGKKTQGLSLWRQLLSGMRERYPFSEDVVYYPGKWSTLERSIQYLGESAVRKMVYYDPDNSQSPTDPDEG